jgi:hypothetical protein
MCYSLGLSTPLLQDSKDFYPRGLKDSFAIAYRRAVK